MTVDCLLPAVDLLQNPIHMKNKTPFLIVLIVLVSTSASAFDVTIHQTGQAANSCTRTLTASVTGGSGNYTYTWSIVTPSMSWPGPNNVSTVDLSLNQTVDVNVSVKDNVTNQITSDTETVYRVLKGSFNIFIPNLITPNGDGYNDNWVVADANKGYGPINAYRFTLVIKNSSNVQVFSDSGTVTSGHLGILGGDILWNARVNGTGSIVPTGVYDYVVVLENCTLDDDVSGQLMVMY